MRVLVTGTAGFIGSHLTDALLHRGDEVVGLDLFDDFYDPAIKRRNLREASRSEGFRLIEGDIRNSSVLEPALRDVDAVAHLAARAGVRPSIEDPRLYVSVNVDGTAALLDACRRAEVDRIVIASSSSVYGGLRTLPFREDMVLEHPYSPYGATKLACEFLAGTWAHLYGLRISCLRYFTVYGPRQRPEMAIHKFVRRIDRGEPVPVFGDGTSRRDYTYVADAVAGTIAALDALDSREPGNRVYNIGESETIELRELVALIARLVGKEPLRDERPDQPGDVPATWADIERAREELGYDPSTPLEEGLQRFIEWYGSEEGAS